MWTIDVYEYVGDREATALYDALDELSPLKGLDWDTEFITTPFATGEPDTYLHGHIRMTADYKPWQIDMVAADFEKGVWIRRDGSGWPMRVDEREVS